MSFPSQLEARDLHKSFRGRGVVNGVSFQVTPGEVVGLLGPNGAGKTTSFHILVGLLRADQGQVFFRGQDVSRWPMHKRARLGLGYLSQEPSVFRRLSVRDNLKLVLETHGIKGAAADERVENGIHKYSLQKVKGSLASTLSGGERRRLEIARAMIQNPTFLLLDEPFSGIDPITVDEIREQIRILSAEGIGVLITDHNVRETLSICHRAYIVKDGVILEEGTPAHISQSPQARALYLGERFQLDPS